MTLLRAPESVVLATLMISISGVAGCQKTGLAPLDVHASPEPTRLVASALAPDPAGMPGEQIARWEIRIGPGVTVDALLEVTNKGNGVLSVAGLSLRAYDDHDDGRVFEPRLLDVCFLDFSGDGYADMIICGLAVQTATSDINYGNEPVVGVFRFEPASRSFVRIYSRGPETMIADSPG